jgi:hypothetical protein
MIESLVYLTILLVLLGVLLWVIKTYFVPIPQPVMVGLVVIVLLLVLLWVLGALPTPYRRIIP